MLLFIGNKTFLRPSSFGIQIKQTPWEHKVGLDLESVLDLFFFDMCGRGFFFLLEHQFTFDQCNFSFN